MNAHAAQDALSKLCELELITEAQRNLALQHKEAHEVLAEPSVLGDVLTWLVARDIVPEEELLAMAGEAPDNMSDAGLQQRQAIIADAQEKLGNLKFNLNLDALTTLRDTGIITEEQFSKIVDELPNEGAFASPAAAMVWITVNDLLTEEELQNIHDQLEKDRSFPSAQERVAILTEADEKLKEYVDTALKLATKAHWDAVLPGPRWMWILGFVVIFGGYIFYLNKPTPTPECSSSEIQATINNMFLRVKWAADSKNPLDAMNQPTGIPRLKNPKEIGYLVATKTRGCVGVIEWTGHETPYGYTIKPSANRGDEFDVAGASPEIVTARFGHIDAEGQLTNQAEPVGRENVDAAIRAGVTQLNQAGGGNELLKQMRERMRQPDTKIPVNQDREREIAEIEPLAPCRELIKGKKFSCEVLLERNDAFLAAIGQSSLTIVKGVFTLELNEAGSGWKVSSDFSKEYADAIARSRHATLYGTEPAAESAPDK